VILEDTIRRASGRWTLDLMGVAGFLLGLHCLARHGGLY